MIHRILCPLDFSEFSKRSFEHALVLARWYGANVTALHVFAAFMPPGDESTYPGWLRRVPEARREIDRELREQLTTPLAEGMDVPLRLREGDPVAMILEEARELGADLLVVSTHGRSGFDRFTLGSVAEKVLRKSPCPVLVVPAQAAPAPGPFEGYRRVISAIDFSADSRRGLDFALSIAERARSRLTLAHVVEVADNPEVLEGDSPLAVLRRDRVHQARERLLALAAEHDGRGPVIDAVVRLGRSHVELLELAKDVAADLIVLGVRGRGAIDITVFGSTTNQVVRRATCDVLAVGRPE
jgi:nucleotide-binding universal stress UspA family protein